MSVMTMLGEVDKKELGVVLPHEHSCFGVSEFLTPYDDWEMEKTFNGDVTLETFIIGNHFLSIFNYMIYTFLNVF